MAAVDADAVFDDDTYTRITISNGPKGAVSYTKGNFIKFIENGVTKQGKIWSFGGINYTDLHTLIKPAYRIEYLPCVNGTVTGPTHEKPALRIGLRGLQRAEKDNTWQTIEKIDRCPEAAAEGGKRKNTKRQRRTKQRKQRGRRSSRRKASFRI